jgi:hypothetical protein
MTLTTALKIMGMTAKALTKKYGSRAMGLSKRVKAGDIVTKAKKGGALASKKSAKINRKGGMTAKDLEKEAQYKYGFNASRNPLKEKID